MTSTAVTGKAHCGVYAPILISRRDQLTPETRKMIEDHNDIYFCLCPDDRPPTFDTTICNA